MSAVEYRNPERKSRWQPVLADGDRAWWEYLWGEVDGTVWSPTGNRVDAITYRSRRRAERVARREERRRERRRLNTYREAGKP